MRSSPVERRNAELFWADLMGAARPRSSTRPSHPGEAESGRARAKPPAIEEVIARAQAHHAFVPISSTMTLDGAPCSARIWISDDAVKWIVPSGSVEESSVARRFTDTVDDVMLLKHGARLEGVRRRMWRLPCTAREAQRAADLIGTRQQQLPGASLPPSSTESRPCLLPTSHLYTLRFRQADLRIEPQVGLMDMNVKQGLTAASLEYNRRVSQAAKRVVDARAGAHGPPQLLADPGKVWVIAADLRGNVAVNYGWQRVNNRPWQSEGRRHDTAHSDYSQILVAVAGWCEVARPGAGACWMETANVYQSAELGRLVTGDARRLTKIKYDT